MNSPMVSGAQPMDSRSLVSSGLAEASIRNAMGQPSAYSGMSARLTVIRTVPLPMKLCLQLFWQSDMRRKPSAAEMRSGSTGRSPRTLYTTKLRMMRLSSASSRYSRTTANPSDSGSVSGSSGVHPYRV